MPPETPACATNMTTSAKDRLNSLFANQPLPAKPQPGVPTLFELETKQFRSERPSETILQVESQCAKLKAKEAMQPRGPSGVTVDSDEDDDYVAAYSNNSKKKLEPPRRRYKPEPGALGYGKGDYVEPPAQIQFFPSGKNPASWDESKHDPGSVGIEDLIEKNAGKTMIGQFCLMSSVAKFPYKYMADPHDRVSKRFFAGGKIYSRVWNIFYLHLPPEIGGNPFILVPFDQVKQLIQEISTTFKLNITVPPFPFTIPFYDDGTPQPVFLGTSRSRDEMTELQTEISNPTTGYGECPAGASAELKFSFQNWNERLEASQAASKKSKNAQKRRKHQKRGLTIQEQCDQMKRAQRYLGLRPRMNPVLKLDGLSWDEQQDLMSNQKPNLIVNFLDETKLAPYDFDSQPVIISIDVESYERDHSVITEIGVSTLDTLDLVDTIPGSGGQNWLNHIRSRHFLIKGREHLVNRDFVAGCPQSYQFGDSEEVELSAAAASVDSCFEWPYSVQYKHEGKFRTADDEEKTAAITPNPHPEQVQKGPKQRNLVLLGHDTNTDINYLRNLGSKIFGAPSTDNTSLNTNRNKILASILEALDTATLYQVMKLDTQIKSLASICADLEIAAWYLHNAGNDARYTLEALVKLVVKARKLEDELAKKADSNSTACVETEWEAEKQRRIDEKMAQARCEILEELEHWEKAKAPGTVSPKRASGSFQYAPPITAMNDLKLGETGVDSWNQIEPSTNALTKNNLTQSSSAKEDQITQTEDQDEAWADPSRSDGGSPKIAFADAIEASNKVKTGKKAVAERRRESEMAVRIDGGQGGSELGPVEWAPDGKNGCAN